MVQNSYWAYLSQESDHRKQATASLASLKLTCHFRCSGLKKISGVQNFQCPSCKKGNKREINEGGLSITSGRIEEVDLFCYLGNVLDCEAGIESAVTARVAAAWTKLRDGEFLNKDK